MTIQAMSFKTVRDLVLVNILSALLILVIAFFPNSPVRIILGLPFILFFSGYMLICALFPRKEDLDIIERLALSFGISMAVTSLIGLALNYTSFGIRLYPVTFSLFLFTLLMSGVAIYRRRTISPEDIFAPLSSISNSGWRELGMSKSGFMKFNEENRTIKILSIIALISITLSVILIKNTENIGYEVSIYTAIPLLSWIFLIIGIICGICIVIYNVYTKEHEKNNKWLLGLFLILLSNFIILLLPVFRGYALYGRGDIPSHLGTVLNIISSGHTETKNFYPAVHLYITEFSHICNIDPMILFGYIPVFFSTLYVIYMYCFAKCILPNKGQAILATTASTPLIYGYSLIGSPNCLSMTSPNGLICLLVPLMLFIYFSLDKTALQHKLQFKITFVIFIFLFPVFHPVPTLAILVMIIATDMVNKIYDRLYAKKINTQYNISKFHITSLLLLSVWTITWISSFYVWEYTIRNIHTLIAEGGPTALSDLEHLAITSFGYGYNPYEIAFKDLNAPLLYMLLTLISVPIITKKMFIDKKLRDLILLYGLLVAFFSMMFVLFIGNLPFHPLRLLIFVIIICTIFVGFMLYELLERAKTSKRNLIIVFVILILVLSSVSGILKVHPSPYTLRANNQITYSEIGGMDWFFYNKNINTPVMYLGMPDFRFAAFLISSDERGTRKDITWSDTKDRNPPYHFNYTNHTKLGESYTEDRYMVITKLGRLFYTELWPKLAELRFYATDFEKLNYDPSVDKLYSNGGLDVWKIHSSHSKERG